MPKKTSDLISKKDQNKIDYIKRLRSQGTPKSQVREIALHHLKMKPEHVQLAFENNNIYD